MSNQDKEPPPKPIPPLVLPYTSRAVPPPAEISAAAVFFQFALGVGIYWAPLLAMKSLARRYDWELGGICGVWIVVLAVTAAASTCVTILARWRWVAIGTVVGVLISFLIANVIVG